MKFEKLLISHDTPTQVLESRKILDSMGYKVYSDDRWASDLYIHTYDDGDYQILTMSEWHQGSKEYSFNEFISKYGKQNEMIELINKAKSELKMNDGELSLAIGKSRQYIGKMLRLPQTKKVQDKVIKEISEFMDKAKDQKKFAVEDIKVNLSVDVGLSEKDKQISDLKKANEQQKLVIDKLDDQLIKAEKIHNEDVKAIEKLASDLREEIVLHNITKDKSKSDQDLINELTDALAWEQKEFNKTKDELNEIKSSHTTSKALNWFFVVAIILAAIVWKAYNG